MRLKNGLLILLIFFILIPTAYSIGVGSFDPNLNRTIDAFVINNVGSDIRVKLEAQGELAKYVTFSEEYLDISKDGKKIFTFNLNLPESISPGQNILMIGATDITPPPPGARGIRAVTSAYKAFIIEAPYPGKYIDASFTAQDIELDGTAIFNAGVTSKGEEIIDKIDGFVEIFENDEKIATAALDTITAVNPKESRIMQAKWDSHGHKVGGYRAKATINFDEEKLEREATFKIGTLLIKITNYAKEFYKDEINRFDIEIESFWNTQIDDIYGEVEINDEKLKTLKVSLPPWSETKVTAYLDTHNLELGEHIANIKVNYGENVAEEIGKITVLPKREKIVELPSKMPSTTVLLAVIIILLVIGNIILILYFMKSKKSEKK